MISVGIETCATGYMALERVLTSEPGRGIEINPEWIVPGRQRVGYNEPGSWNLTMEHDYGNR